MRIKPSITEYSVKLFRGTAKKKKKSQSHKKITRSQHMLKHIITMLTGQVNT